ncbi:FkbM family methyltransferase [Candidatus Pacearchaeota archaeon]|nr:FkbM family methyltransferase [Candidatus Pacearchaeota archaeon]
MVESGIYYDFYEPTITRFFKKFLRPGDVVLDVGANVGYYSLLSSRIVGDKGSVYSFEPMTSANKRMQINLLLNNFKNINLEKLGVSDKPGTQKFYFQNQYSMFKSAKGPSEEKVKFVTLDEYVKKNKIKNVRLIKTDTDGFDAKVLLGAREVIKKFHPYVIAEIGADEEGLKDYVDFIFSLKGYSVCSDKGVFYKNKNILFSEIAVRGIINVVLIPKK